ncbi:MAG: hypothetical protein DMF44_04795 [Verrucomicrobia bacterium]|nr:MAG: hypothetical protein DMF44_04795 [Verrucomicrobiota bacterium]
MASGLIFCMTLPIANDSDGMHGDTSTKQSVSQTSWLSRSVERELETKTYKKWRPSRCPAQ